MKRFIEIKIPRLRHPLFKGDGAQSCFLKEVPRNEAEDYFIDFQNLCVSAALQENKR